MTQLSLAGMLLTGLTRRALMRRGELVPAQEAETPKGPAAPAMILLPRRDED